MRWFCVVLFLAGAAQAQSNAGLDVQPSDDLLSKVSETDACINDQITKGPGGLVTRAARSCIGRSARACTADPITCATQERRYWEWRIASSFVGLQAWVADRADVAGMDELQATVANPAAATANVPLECALRISQRGSEQTAAQDTAHCEMRETALIALELEFTVRQACEGDVTGAFARYCGRETE